MTKTTATGEAVDAQQRLAHERRSAAAAAGPAAPLVTGVVVAAALRHQATPQGIHTRHAPAATAKTTR